MTGMIIAVDPGKTTGLAWALFGAGKAGGFGSHECDDWRDAVKVVRREMQVWRAGDPEAVVEHFTIRPDTHRLSQQLDALYCIGALEYEAWRVGFPLVHQTPAAAKTIGTDARLHRMGWYNGTPGGHANDAARHLLVRAIKLDLIDRKALLP